MAGLPKNNEDKRTKVVVIGFDGCTFDILKPLIEQGKLPHFAALMEEGVVGKLKSSIPPLSGPAWASFQTGLNPGKHGIYDFLRNTPRDYGCVPINSTFLPSKTLWEIISAQGRRVGVLNVLFNYPPKKVNGFIVSGKETPGEDKPYTYPAALKEEILGFEPRYEAVPFKQISPTKRFLRGVCEKLKQQERVNNYLFKKYPCDFFITYHAVPDVIQHVFWAHLDPAHPNYKPETARSYLPLIEECFKTMDQIIGRKLKLIDDNTTLMVISDHGAGSVYRKIQLNKWLQDQGLFVLKHRQQKRNIRSSLSFLENGIKGLLNVGVRFDVFGLIRRIGYKTRQKRMALLRDTLIDWSQTKAYAGRVAEYGIHINLKGRQGQGIVEPGREYERIREAIISGLAQIRDPQSGKKVFRKIWKREEVFEGVYVNHAPDLILDFGDTPCLPGSKVTADKLFEKVLSRGLGGMHRDFGIFIAKGRGLKKGGLLDGAAIVDLAPTILYQMGLDIPKAMDGRVLFDIFEPAFVKQHPARYDDKDYSAAKDEAADTVYSEDEAEDIRERLRSLGYL